MKRIPEIIGALHELWLKNPDLRLLQLVMNYTRSDRADETQELFYQEDDISLQNLLENVEKLNKH
jgi:uncharacterized protein YihD (DUF1040 family)